MRTNPDKYVTHASFITDVLDDVGARSTDIPKLRHQIADLVIGQAKASEGPRPPCLYLVGSSGVGKSSLINALAGHQATTVGAVKPTTMVSHVYDITINDGDSTFEVVDSRGLFETVPADGDVPIDTVQALSKDIDVHRPDILIHVITPDNLRAGVNEFEALDDISGDRPGGLPPRLICLNKVDSHIAPGAPWPPQENTELQEQLADSFSLLADVLNVSLDDPLILESPYRGRRFDSRSVVGVVPTYAKSKPYWNVETLLDVLGVHSPAESILDHARKEQHRRSLRRLARKQIRAVAEAICDLPPGQLLSPRVPIRKALQRCIVGFVGSYSGRPLSTATVKEYYDTLSQTDVLDIKNQSYASGATGGIISAAGITPDPAIGQWEYAIGRSAEVYFFDGDQTSPKEFYDEAEAELTLL